MCVLYLVNTGLLPSYAPARPSPLGHICLPQIAIQIDGIHDRHSLEPGSDIVAPPSEERLTASGWHITAAVEIRCAAFTQYSCVCIWLKIQRLFLIWSHHTVGHFVCKYLFTRGKENDGKHVKSCQQLYTYLLPHKQHDQITP